MNSPQAAIIVTYVKETIGKKTLQTSNDNGIISQQLSLKYLGRRRTLLNLDIPFKF